VEDENKMTNVEIIKAVYAAYAAGDLATIQSYMTEDVIWTVEGHPVLTWTGNFAGKDSTTAFFSRLQESFADPKLDMEIFISEGDKVATFGRYRATVRKNRVQVDTPIAHYFRLRGGKIAEHRNFTNSALLVDAMNTTTAKA
jgi:ketosteroid isomerase-like protein